MKKSTLIGALIFNSLCYSKSYFVKLNNAYNLLPRADKMKLIDNSIHKVKFLKSNIAPSYAVIDSNLTKKELEKKLEERNLEVAYIESNEIEYSLLNYHPKDPLV